MSNTPSIRFTLRQLQYFAAVVRTGQISMAAAECNVTQSTMTAAIAELERALDTLLFERSRSGVVLTYKGHLFLQHAQTVLDAASDAARHPFRDSSALSGTLQLAASYTVLGYFILPFIAKFHKAYPNARVIPIERDRTHIEEGIASGELEMAVTLTSNMTDLKRFQRRVLTRSRRQLWLSPQHPLVELGQVSLEEMTPFPYILPAVDEGDKAGMGYWNRVNLVPASYLRTTSMEAVREMVALGLGVTILSDMVFRPWSLDGRRILALPVRDPIPPMEVGLVWSKSRELSSVAAVLIDYLETAMRVPHAG